MAEMGYARLSDGTRVRVMATELPKKEAKWLPSYQKPKRGEKVWKVQVVEPSELSSVWWYDTGKKPRIMKKNPPKAYKDACVQMSLEARHYAQTGRGKQFLEEAIHRFDEESYKGNPSPMLVLGNPSPMLVLGNSGSNPMNIREWELYLEEAKGYFHRAFAWAKGGASSSAQIEFEKGITIAGVLHNMRPRTKSVAVNRKYDLDLLKVYEMRNKAEWAMREEGNPLTSSERDEVGERMVHARRGYETRESGSFGKGLSGGELSAYSWVYDRFGNPFVPHGAEILAAAMGNPKKKRRKNKKLTTAARKKLPARDFGLPKSRKYPMPDRAHAKNAKARASAAYNEGYLTKSQYDHVVRKADRMLYPERAARKAVANPKKKLKMSKKARQFIQRHIRRHIKKYGWSPARAAATAYDEATRKGYKVPPPPIKGRKRNPDVERLPAYVRDDPKFKKELTAYRKRHGQDPVSVTSVKVPKGYPKYMTAYGQIPEAKYDAAKGSAKGKRIHHFGDTGGKKPYLVSSVDRGDKFLAIVGGDFKAKTDWLYD